MSTISRNQGGPEFRAALKQELESAKGQLKQVETQIHNVEDRMDRIRAKIHDLEGKKSSAEHQAAWATVREKVDAGWVKLTGNFAKKLVGLAGALGQRSFTVTTHDLEKDPHATKTSTLLRITGEEIASDIKSYQDMLKSWTTALGHLKQDRTELKDTIAAHSQALTKEWVRAVGAEVGQKVHAGLELAGTAYAAVAATTSGALKGLQKKMFSGLKQVSFAVANYAAEKELSGAKGDKEKLSKLKAGPALEASIASTLASVPVPVPVSRQAISHDASQVPPLFLDQVWPPLLEAVQKQPPLLTDGMPPLFLLPPPAPTAVKAEQNLPLGVELVDARDIYKLPPPKTGRDWVAMLAGVDYSKIGQELPDGTRLRERDVDEALKTMGATKAIKYQGQTVKDVKHNIEKRYGLKEGAALHDIRVEVDRRAAADISPFATAKELAAALSAHGLPVDAGANRILQKMAFGVDIGPE
ncbi:MAG: hypothetical protein U1E65_10790 [Myxococcota bacterium]